MDDMMKKIGIIVTLIVIVLGSYCTIDLFKILNIKSAVIGYFYTEPEVVKISDFKYDITSLLFYSADNENQYYATVNAKPVSNFDSTKKYTVTINGIEAKAVEGSFNFVNANFTNQFNSSLDEVILTDTLNIKINFYKEGTKILFVTNGGEQAVSLWSSYIQKNGFTLKIIETHYSSTIEADNLPSSILNNTLSITTEDIVNLNNYSFDLYTPYEFPKYAGSKYGEYRFSKEEKLFSKEDKSFFEKIFNTNYNYQDSFEVNLEIKNLLGLNFSFNKNNLNFSNITITEINDYGTNLFVAHTDYLFVDKGLIACGIRARFCIYYDEINNKYFESFDIIYSTLNNDANYPTFDYSPFNENQILEEVDDIQNLLKNMGLAQHLDFDVTLNFQFI